MKQLLVLFILALEITAHAQEPVYRIIFDDTDNMTILGERNLVFYPATERVKEMLDSNLGKDIVTADHACGIIVRTESPDLASQDVLNQLSRQTGEKIGRIWNSNLKKAAPTAILMGSSPTTTWYIVISPRDKGDYILTISYLIEEKKKPQDPVGLVPYSETD